MHPVLIDLSQWNPFGLSLSSFHAKALAMAILAAVGIGAWSLLAGRRQRRRPGRPDALMVLGVVVLVVVAVGILWVVGKVHSYGFMMALGFLVAIPVARRKARHCGEDPDVINNLAILALVGGVLGARISFVVEHWRDFGPAVGPGGQYRDAAERLVDVLKLTSGGLVFDGGLILAVALTLGYLRWRHLPARRFLDILAISAMVGLAFGRVGCFLNGCCYGGACRDDFPLAVRFPYAAEPIVFPHDGANPYPAGTSPSPVYCDQFVRDRRLAVPPELVGATFGHERTLKMPAELATESEFAAGRAARSLPVHPAQLYGIANALVLAGLLYAVLRLRSREGQVFAMLLVLYPLTRFALEYIRDDNPDVMLTPAQWKCIVMLAVGAAMLAALRWLPASCPPASAGRQAAAREVPSKRAGGRGKRQNR